MNDACASPGGKRGAANRLAVEFLRECFDYRDGVLYWRERPASHFQRPSDRTAFNTKFAGKKAGKSGPRGYVQIGLRVNGVAISMAAHRVVWALHRGAWPSQHIDHINRRPADNRIENLRDVTPAENNKNVANKRVHQYVEQYYHGRFVAQTNVGGQTTIHIGIFDTEAEAIAHRDMVNGELEKLARRLAKKTPRPPVYRKRNPKAHRTFPQETPPIPEEPQSPTTTGGEKE